MASLNEVAIKALPTPERGNKVHYFPGAVLQGQPAPRGFGVRVTAGGAKAFVLNYRHAGREYRYTIGQWPDWSALKAVREARELRQRIDRGENIMEDRAPPAPAEAPKTLNDVLDDYERRELDKLRTARKVSSMFRRLIRPTLGELPINELKRRHVVELLDRIEEENGLVQVDRVLAHFGKALRWYAIRDDEFHNPIVTGMARNLGEARSRVLSDDEIRAIWPALHGTFGDICKVLLLTAQRRGDIAGMRWAEITADRVLVIPASRYKTKREHAVPLTDAAWEIIERQPRRAEYVFTGQRGGLYKPFHNDKDRLDRAVPLPDWTLHDLRRTGRSLLARAGIQPHIAERVLGHTMGKVEGTYDRHTYEAEKRMALEALAAMVERILHPPAENVVALRG